MPFIDFVIFNGQITFKIKIKRKETGERQNLKKRLLYPSLYRYNCAEKYKTV